MSEPKILALEDDAPIARKPRPYTARRTALYDVEGWNLMAQAAPIRREIVPWASPDVAAAPHEKIRENAISSFKCWELSEVRLPDFESRNLTPLCWSR